MRITIKCEHINHKSEYKTYYQGHIACCAECLYNGFIVKPKIKVLINNKVVYRIK